MTLGQHFDAGLNSPCGELALGQGTNANELRRRHDQPHGRIAVELAQGEYQLERHDRAVGEQGAGFERVVAPAALQAGSQRSFERGVRWLLEQIHDRLADQAIGFGQTEQLEPRSIGIDQDALLDLGDGVIGALQHQLELAAVILRGA